MKLSVLTETLICRSLAAAGQLPRPFPKAVPPRISGSLGKGPHPLLKNICFAALAPGLLSLHSCWAPTAHLKPLQQPARPWSPVLRAHPSPAGVRTGALALASTGSVPAGCYQPPSLLGPPVLSPCFQSKATCSQVGQTKLPHLVQTQGSNSISGRSSCMMHRT